MGLERLEVHFQAFFLTDRRVNSDREKIDSTYMIILAQIFSVGRRQEKYASSADVHPRKKYLNFLVRISAGT